MKENSFIHVRGARTHNLKKIDVDIKRNALVVITGDLARKSSLAFDTIYAESQRRCRILAITAENLFSAPEPDVDLIEGLSPSIALSKKILFKTKINCGTLTDIFDYLQVLFATEELHTAQFMAHLFL